MPLSSISPSPRVGYVYSLELAVSDDRLNRLAADEALTFVEEGESAFVDAGSTVAFLDGYR